VLIPGKQQETVSCEVPILYVGRICFKVMVAKLSPAWKDLFCPVSLLLIIHKNVLGNAILLFVLF
jgi:hypothetical protein